MHRSIAWSSLVLVVLQGAAACSANDDDLGLGYSSRAAIGDRCGANRDLVGGPGGGLTVTCKYSSGQLNASPSITYTGTLSSNGPTDYLTCRYCTDCKLSGATMSDNKSCIGGSVGNKSGSVMFSCGDPRTDTVCAEKTDVAPPGVTPATADNECKRIYGGRAVTDLTNQCSSTASNGQGWSTEYCCVNRSPTPSLGTDTSSATDSTSTAQ